MGWSVSWPCEAAGQTVAASDGACALGSDLSARAGPLSATLPCRLGDLTSILP